MNSDPLSIFITVAEEMNFTRAARKLYITQQSLSGHIKRLESKYNVQLFERKPNLKLTPAGKAFLFYARQMTAAERNLIDSFADISRESTGYLDMGISHQRSGVFFEDFWIRFHPSYPNIDIRLHEENTAGLLKSLQQGEISLMIGVDVPASTRYHSEKISDERMRCIVSRSLIERFYPGESADLLEQCSRRGVEPTALSALPLIVLPEGNRFRKTMNRMFHSAGIMPNIILESNQQDLALRLCLRGEGMAFLSPIVLYDYFRKNNELPADCYSFEVPNADENTINLVCIANEEEPHFVKAMKDAIRDTYKEYNKTMILRQSK